MNKEKQKALTRWLRQQRQPAAMWLRLVTLLGILSGLLIVIQAWLLATLLHAFIIEHTERSQMLSYFFAFIGVLFLRALCVWLKERASFIAGSKIRSTIRKQVLSHLKNLGPIWIKEKPAGSWSTILLEQIENLHDYYARYLPQMTLAATTPLMILIAVFPNNWAAGVILFVTAPLIPIFMALVGMGAADASQRNFAALARLSGSFLDRLKGLDTLRLFHAGKRETSSLKQVSEEFRSRTMNILKIAFLSSATLEFFASLSIAVIAVYFGFSYLGELNFGHYGNSVTLFVGFFTLILAPEFYQPLRDLGTFYHAKAQAVGAAESLVDFLDNIPQQNMTEKQDFTVQQPLSIVAREVIIYSPQGEPLVGPISFNIDDNEKIAIIGHSGAGKSTIINLLLGFLPYKGSLTINGIELQKLSLTSWQKQLSWIGQNPNLPAETLRENILLAYPNCSEAELQILLKESYVDEFLESLPNGIDTHIGENASRLSVGQAQRVAVARALLRPCRLLLLDEPTASLDVNSENFVLKSLKKAISQQATVMVTHQLNRLNEFDTVWLFEKGKLIQSGSYQQLSQTEGFFKNLVAYASQEI